jgi:pimeloyl-ACP methyl ester carboxylesterase
MTNGTQHIVHGVSHCKVPTRYRRLVATLVALSSLALSGCNATFGGDRLAEQKESARVKNFTTFAPAPLSWRLSGASTLNALAPWKLVIVTGTPSWSEFWRPGLADAPDWLEVVVVDRPGFGASEPKEAVVDIETQAQALSVLVEPSFPGQKVVLLGQSYGGPVSALIAARNPDKVNALILTSAFFGDRGPTIQRLHSLGTFARPFLDRDLKNGLLELRSQAPQLPLAMAALRSLKVPVLVLHGAKDTFVPIAAARRLSADVKADLVELPEGDHFLNQCCIADVLATVTKARNIVEATLAQASR